MHMYLDHGLNIMAVQDGFCPVSLSQEWSSRCKAHLGVASGPCIWTSDLRKIHIRSAQQHTCIFSRSSAPSSSFFAWSSITRLRLESLSVFRRTSSSAVGRLSGKVHPFRAHLLHCFAHVSITHDTEEKSKVLLIGSVAN